MALELIQNADDAGAASLVFDARDEALVVDNDGDFTSCGLRQAECPWIRSGDPSGLRRPCNFHAIAEMGSRSKLHAAEHRVEAVASGPASAPSAQAVRRCPGGLSRPRRPAWHPRCPPWRQLPVPPATGTCLIAKAWTAPRRRVDLSRRWFYRTMPGSGRGSGARPSLGRVSCCKMLHLKSKTPLATPTMHGVSLALFSILISYRYYLNLPQSRSSTNLY